VGKVDYVFPVVQSGSPDLILPSALLINFGRLISNESRRASARSGMTSTTE
jgi:hypothetical protein